MSKTFSKAEMRASDIKLLLIVGTPIALVVFVGVYFREYIFSWWALLALAAIAFFILMRKNKYQFSIGTKKQEVLHWLRYVVIAALLVGPLYYHAGYIHIFSNTPSKEAIAEEIRMKSPALSDIVTPSGYKPLAYGEYGSYPSAIRQLQWGPESGCLVPALAGQTLRVRLSVPSDTSRHVTLCITHQNDEGYIRFPTKFEDNTLVRTDGEYPQGTYIAEFIGPSTQFIYGKQKQIQ